MSALKVLVGALIVAFGVCLASVSRAQVSCTINGSITLEPSDSYYCDTEILGTSACSAWREQDLDSTTVPIAYMNVCVQLEDNSKLDCTNSDANGNWSATFTLPGTECAGQQVDIRHYFARVHEDDVASDAPRLRFWLVDVDEGDPDLDDSRPGNAVWGKSDSGVTLQGPTTTYSWTWSRGSIQTSTRLANIFYTASSYLKEVTTWSSNLDARFTARWGEVPLKIGYEETFPNGAVTLGPNEILIGYDAFSLGFFVRHELGHVTHLHAHHDDIDGECATYNFCSSCPPPANADEQAASEVRSCEYGSTANYEGLASFFAVRSITSNGTQAWDCSCGDYDWDGSGPDTANWDVCSEQALLPSDPDGDADWIWNCNTGDFTGLSFIYVGDFRSSSTANCARLRADGGCDCEFSGSPSCDATFDSMTGWRNSSQVMRFFWDMIDSSTDSGQDDTNIGIDTFVAHLESMPCVGNHGGEDGSCEEYAIPSLCGTLPFPPCECSPAVDGETSPSGTGTRDSYNVWDIAEVISGDQFDERILNCVQGAQD